MMEVVEKWQDLTNRLIETSLEVLKRGVLPEEDLFAQNPKVIAILLLARTLSHAKAVRALVKAGRVLEARIITRNCLENGFWIGGLIDEGQAFVDKMVHDEQKRRTMRGQFLFEQGILTDEDAASRLSSWMKERKHWKDSKTLDPKGVTKGGTFEKAYIFYSELSMDAHPGLEALARYLARDDDAELDFEPKIDLVEVIDTLHLHTYAVLTVLVSVNQMLGHGADEVLSKLTEDFQELEREFKAA